MGIWKRSCMYITRKKIRSFILFFILFVMGLFLLIGISIRSAAGEAAEEVKKTLPTGLEIKILPADDIYDFYTDENGATVRTLKAQVMTHSRINELLDIEGVYGCYMGSDGTDLYYTGLDMVPGFMSQPLTQEELDSWYNYNTLPPGDVRDPVWSKSAGFYYVEDGQYCPYFMNGSMELVAGRHIQINETKKALISDTIAEKNGLGIGDTITAQNFDTIPDSVPYGSIYELEIVGIFKVNFEQRISEYTSEENILENIIFSTPELFDWSVDEGRAHSGLEPLIKKDDILGKCTLYIEDPMMLDSIKEKVLAIENVDWSYYHLTDVTEEYKAAAAPLLTIKKIFTALIVFVFIGTLVILSLILSMWIQSRKQEIGILTSLGIPTPSILLQLVLECFLIAIAAFLLAGPLAKPVTGAIGNTVEILFSPSETEDPYKVDFNEYYHISIHKTPSDPIKLEHSITIVMILTVFAAMLFTALFSTLHSSLRIVKQKPREIFGKL